MVNLIDNAVKYSGPGSSVRVEAAKDDGQVEVKVQDQGVGIPQEHLPRLFERFYRVDPSRSRKVGGTGLGVGDCQAHRPGPRGQSGGGERPRPGKHLYHLPAG